MSEPSIDNLSHLKELSLNDLINLGNGQLLNADNLEFEEKEDRDFLRNIPTTNDDIIEALAINDDDDDDDYEAPLRGDLRVPNFDTLRKKMMDVAGNSMVLKLVRKSGIGNVIPRDCQVSIKYLAFFEFQDEPFDSSFAHKRAVESVKLNQGSLIPGLDFAISTMKKHETSMFLIQPEAAYGKMGCLPRIPPDSEVLFVVTVVDFVDNGSVELYEELDADEKKSSKIVLPRVKDIMNTAKDSFNQKKYRQAIREYGKAVKWMDVLKPDDDDEEKEMKILLAKAYTNLALCYNLEGKPRAACNACTNNPIPSTKSLFQHGRALAKIGESEDAMKKLQEALKTEPNNRTIIAEIAMVNDQLERYKVQRKKLWSHCLKVTKAETLKTEFQKAVEEMCKMLVNDENSMRQSLPEGLNPQEEECVRCVAAAHGLSVTTYRRFGKEELYLSKNY